jgi:hypothetical protein
MQDLIVSVYNTGNDKDLRTLLSLFKKYWAPAKNAA